MVLPLAFSAVGCGDMPWRLGTLLSGRRSGGGAASRSCLDPTCGGWTAPEMHQSPQQLLPACWQMLLRLHFEHPLFPVDATLWHMAPATSIESDDFSEGRMLSCLMDAQVSLGHFPEVREPTVLRLVCQYVLALHNVTVWPSQPTLCRGSALWSGLMDDGLRLPPLHCCYLGPHDFYRRVYFGTSASHCTVARAPRSHTQTYLARPSPLHLNLNTVAGELFGLVPALRRTHVALRLLAGS